MKVATLLIPNTILTTSPSSLHVYIHTPAVCIGGVDAVMPHGMLHMSTKVMHLGYDKDKIRQAKSIGYCPASRK
jgi:hypothetical protein